MIPCEHRLTMDGLAIFLFHGVITRRRHEVRNYTGKHLTVERFVSVLKSLKEAGHPVSLDQIVESRLNGTPLPKRAFAITFDDGFDNNYSVAAPILHEMRVPATFYVTTGFIDANGSSWIDLIEYAVERVSPCRVTLPHAGIDGVYTGRAEKLQFLDLIRKNVKSDPRLDPYEVALDIWKQLGVTSMDPDRDLDQKMSWKQVAELDQDPLFAVGGHGHTHRILSYLDECDLESEVVTSCNLLIKHLGHPVRHYSYPEGLETCYSDRVIAVLRRHGIQCAPTALDGINGSDVGLFHLRRIMVA
jgi:peptidoglycan/xylan/chitin deacetylase (PgdA/CDA1 family)